jgi:hypothetical protein
MKRRRIAGQGRERGRIGLHNIERSRGSRHLCCGPQRQVPQHAPVADYRFAGNERP